MEVPIEDSRSSGFRLLDFEVVYTTEDVDRGLSEDPAFRVVPGHDPHADAEVAVPHEDVDGLAQAQLGLYLLTISWCGLVQEEQARGQ